MTFSSFFTSASSILSKRIETLRAAEAGLVSLSKTFGGSEGYNIEVFDTRIPKSCVPIQKSKCMLWCEDDAKGDDTYTIHGVRLTPSETANTKNDKNVNRPPLVLLHGYCNAALYFYRNLNGLREHFQTVYSLDMFGWGLSSRPTFKTTDNTVESAEDVFVESLEAWRKANRIEKMILAGHSMGGYFVVAYCEKYPERVERLMLISPVGVPHLEGEHEISSPSLRARMMFGLAKTLWRNNITPGSFIRSLTEYRGRSFVRWYVDRRLPAITSEDEKEVLCEYMYTNNILPGSGEYALNRVLKPIAYARKPTINRIPKLKIPNISFIYGINDWMDPTGGAEVQQKCKEMGEGAPNVDVYTVRHAGHLMFLENWEEFNAAMIVADDGVLRPGLPTPKKFDASTYKPPRFG